MKSGILTDALLTDLHSLPVLEGGLINKGIVLLNAFRRQNGISWDVFNSWLKHLRSAASILSLSATKVKISRIEGKVKELKRNKKHEQLHELNMEPFVNANDADEVEPKTVKTIPLQSATSSTFDVDALAMAKKKQNTLQEKCLRQKEHLTQDIVQCGLWHSPDEIVHGLANRKQKV